MANQGVQLQADETSIDLARRLKQARDYSKQWGEVANVIKDETGEHIKELAVAQGADPDDVTAIVGTAGTKVLGITEYYQDRLDMDALMKDHPEIDFDSYKVKTLVRQLRPGKI